MSLGLKGDAMNSMRHVTIRTATRGGVHALLQDQGWTFIEAAFSVILISIVFLGFTVSLLAFRETFSRAWAMRIMDQYAMNFSDEVRDKLRTATNRQHNPPTHNYEAFKLQIPEYKFSNLINIVIASHNYNFSIQPVKGIMIGIDNVAPQAFDWEFENANWTENHRFFIGDFKLDTLWFKENGTRQPYFYNAMGKIDFTVRYERARQVETNLGMIGRTFKYEKSYSISAFMKNNIDQPD